MAKKSTKTANLESIRDAEYSRMQNDPGYVVKDVFGDILWEDQQRILESVRDHPKTAWRSCHGIGKSFVCARLVLWWLFSHPYSIVLITGPTWRQVSDIIWKEIRSGYHRSITPLGGNLAPSATQLAIDGKEWVAIGLSTNDPNRFQGYQWKGLCFSKDKSNCSEGN